MSAGNPNQHTDEWWRARRGRITASRMHKVMTGGIRAWQTLATALEAERMMDTMPPPDENEHQARAIRHGIECEPIARSNAELILGDDVELVGFIPHPTHEFIGASPDYLYGGCPGEIKCPWKLEKHMEVYRTLMMPDEHKPQVQCQIEVTGADMGYFVSYHPNAGHWRMCTVIIEVPRDQPYINVMMERCTRFQKTVIEHAPLMRSLSTVPRLF